jgi:perosamine synthetase
MSETLALLGGPKTITQPFLPYNSIGKEEVDAAKNVVETGVLSKFLGCWELPDFYGGEKVQELEKNWAKFFNVKHAISVNSNTSGLIVALGAIGIEPGDEVIVSPWTMCASATSILVWNAIPVFADIEEETFNLDPQSIEKNITPFTKAIILPDIFGQAAQLDEIMAIAQKHNLKVIEDAAQAPGALYKNRYVGTVADIGVFSLNYHKHIHTGEGGICVTDNSELAERMQLIRNHAEACVEDKGVTNLTNMIGFNFRMTEIEAAIGIEQLKKLKRLADERTAVADRLSEGLRNLKGLRSPVIREGNTHVYYVYPIIVDENKIEISRQKLIEALQAEGVPGLNGGYANLHLMPMYQQKIAYGSKGFPWKSEFCKRDVPYAKGICPVAEKLQDSRYMGIELCLHQYTDNEVDLVIDTFRKVWANLASLADIQEM